MIVYIFLIALCVALVAADEGGKRDLAAPGNATLNLCGYEATCR